MGRHFNVASEGRRRAIVIDLEPDGCGGAGPDGRVLTASMIRNDIRREDRRRAERSKRSGATPRCSRIAGLADERDMIRRPMKTLYFDVDGTVVLGDENRAKPNLAGGRLEAAVRRAGFERLVCVGKFSRVAHFLKEIRSDYDELGALFGICRGVFADEAWFRSVVSFITDSEHRFRHVDLTTDWWYVDDLAVRYIREEGREDVLMLEKGRRILIPSPTGDGQDILNWLSQTTV